MLLAIYDGYAIRFHYNYYHRCFSIMSYCSLVSMYAISLKMILLTNY